jgi:Family of unknown function (DUF5681)
MAGQPGRGPPHKFKPGQSGNPGGKSKEAAEIERLARELSRPALTVLGRIMVDEKAPHAARVAAANHILDRGLGKPKQPLEHTGELTFTPGIDAPPRIAETREEWLARRRAELETLVSAPDDPEIRH